MSRRGGRRRKKKPKMDLIRLDSGKKTVEEIIGAGSQLVNSVSKASRQHLENISRSFSAMAEDPPMPLFDLAHLVVNNTWHSRCIDIKATVATSPGWYIVSDDEGKDVEDLEKFFDQACNGEGATVHNDFASLLRALAIDLCSLGNAYIEVVRDIKGRPVEFFHVPALSVRKRRNHNGFWQLAQMSRTVGETAYSDHNTPSAARESYNLYGAGQYRRRIFFKEYGDTDEYLTDGTKAKAPSEDNRATEIIHIRQYHPLSPIYGIPTWIACFSAIVADEASEKYNLAFFENNRVPRWMITLAGAELDEEDKEDLRVYWGEILRGRPHKPFVFAYNNPNAKIEATKLEADPNEASFLEYRQSNRDEIVAAHGVPPRMLGIITKGQLGGKGDAQKQREDFKSFTVQPLQTLLLAPFVKQVLPELGYEGYGIVLREFDTSDSEELHKMTDAGKILFSMGFASINEVRCKLGFDELDEEWANKYFWILGNQVIPINNDTIERLESQFAENSELESELQGSKKRLLEAIDREEPDEGDEDNEELEEEEEDKKVAVS